MGGGFSVDLPVRMALDKWLRIWTNEHESHEEFETWTRCKYSGVNIECTREF